MTRNFIRFSLIVLTLFVAGCTHTPNKPNDETPIAREAVVGEKLLFSGTVADIRVSPQPASINPYVVTFKVEKILAGNY